MRCPLGFVSGAGLAFAVAAVVTFAQEARAQQPNVEFTVSGTSTVRGWACSASGVLAVTPGSDAAKPAPGFPKGLQSATVTVPVKAFKCPNEEMTQHLMEAMKADKFSDIVYKLEKYDVAGSQAQASGTITILDVTQPATFPIALSTSAQGTQIQGNTRLDMTKFGVEPPVVMLGLLKVRPEIRIEFKGLLAPQ